MQTTRLFGAKVETPIILTAKPPTYPSIAELDYGYSIASKPRPMIIFRHFAKMEIILKTLEGWKNLRQVIVNYYKVQQKPNLAGMIDHHIKLEDNLQAKLSYHGGKKSKDKTLILEIHQTDADTKTTLFPRAVESLAENIYDNVTDDIFQIFSDSWQLRAKILINKLIEKLTYHEENHAIAQFKDSKEFDDEDALSVSLINDKNIPHVLRLVKNRKIRSLTSEEKEIVKRKRNNDDDKICTSTKKMKISKTLNEKEEKKNNIIFDDDDDDDDKMCTPTKKKMKISTALNEKKKNSIILDDDDDSDESF